MRKLLINTAIVLATCLSFNAAYAQAAKKAAPEVQKPSTLEQLLEVVRKGRIAESAEQRKREAQFQREKNRQARLLADAKEDRRREEARSVRLEATFNKNEERLTVLTDQLKKRLGSLRELFGVLQQVSGDARGKFETSVISAQIPGRGEFLSKLAKKMGTSTELATIEEIERVVYELQREMTESSKVVKFKTTVVAANGENEEREVVRVGGFNLVDEDGYFVYKDGKVLELQRQPDGQFVSTTSDILSADDGFVAFGVDPSRGSILELLVLAPNLIERIHQGGTVGYIIIVVGIIALLIALERMVALQGVSRKVANQINSSTPSDDNPLGRVLMAYSSNKTIDTETLELKLNEAILKETPALLKFVTLLKIIAVVAPLMGLLGTVTGMINTFQAITLFGTGDPKLMAGGISQALVTTVLGLCVAIPITLLHSIVSTRSKNVIHVLEEQSAGLIASHNEKSRKG